MHKALRDAVARHTKPAIKKWVITGTDTSLGSRDLDHSWEWAATEAEAWEQAMAHAAGTRFTPETIEEDLI